MSPVTKQKKLLISLFVILALLITGLKIGASIDNVKMNVGLNSSCSLDNLSGAAKLGPNTFGVSSLTSAVTFQGWISNPTSNQAPEKFSISLADEKNFVKWFKESKPDFPRPDVVAAYNVSEEMLTSGFNVQANLVELVPGKYTILMQGQYSDNRILCNNIYNLVISE